jgi:exonuclease III
MRTSSWAVYVLSACVLLAVPARMAIPESAAAAGTFKIAYYNIQSGMGVTQLSGSCSFERNSNCTDASKPLNAWGVGVVQAELDRALNPDPAVIALGLSEAWTCASPANVRKALGWAAHTGERNGVSLVARHGFAGPAEWFQLDTSLNSNPADTMWVVRAPVCADAACSQSIEVFSAHWYAGGATRVESFERQARQTAEFMDLRPAGEPRVLVGDLNVWEEEGVVCNQSPVPSAMQILRDAANVDAWPAVHGTAEGYTGMWNRNGCGSPNGYLWKRIDQAWAKNLGAPVSMTRFGMMMPGACGPSDHAGIIVEYAWPGIDTTAPTAAITAPAAGATVSGSTTIAVNAADDVGIARVGITLNGAALVELTTAPWQIVWNTATVANGSHTIGAWAQDAAGNRTYAASRTVWVDNAPANTAPAASFTTARCDAGPRGRGLRVHRHELPMVTDGHGATASTQPSGPESLAWAWLLVRRRSASSTDPSTRDDLVEDQHVEEHAR